MDLACSDCSARGMASDWLLSLLLGTAVYGSVRTVVWKDGMGSNPMPPIRLMVPETGVEPVRNFVAADFKSATSTNSVIPAPKPMLRTLSGFRSVQTKKGSLPLPFFLNSGAGDESRTRDLNLGKVALYQLSYSRRCLEARGGIEPP